MGVVRSLLEVLQDSILFVRRMLGECKEFVRSFRVVVRRNLLGECEVFDRVGSCKEKLLGEM